MIKVDLDAEKQLRKEVRQSLRAVAREAGRERRAVHEDDVRHILDDAFLSNGVPRPVRWMFIVFALLFSACCVLGIFQLRKTDSMPTLLMLGICGASAALCAYFPIRRSYLSQSAVDPFAKHKILEDLHSDGLVDDRDFSRLSTALLGGSQKKGHH